MSATHGDGQQLRYDRFGGIEVLRCEAQQRPTLQPGEVLVRTRAAALNPKDVLVRMGRFRRLSGPPPITPGFDFCGEVMDARSDLPAAQPGTLVFGMLGGMRGGALASWLRVPARRVLAAPAGFDATTLAAIPLAGLTALQALRDLGRVRRGSGVLINGASGGVGALAVQIARRLNAKVTTLSSGDNLEFCRRLGAHCALSYEEPERLADQEFDVFFDVYGNWSLARARRFLAPDGSYVSTVPKARNFRDHGLTLLSLGRRARVVLVRHRDGDLAWLREALVAGALRPIVDSVYPLEAFADAFHRLETRHARGKIVVTIP